MNQIIFFENIDKKKPNFLVKNVYNKSNKMSNWSKISSSNSVDDTVEHKKLRVVADELLRGKKSTEKIYLGQSPLDI